tara:strand:+ start:317 stop:1141 length:825 start_codon:yes stop_codon:yes gene_type:complete
MIKKIYFHADDFGRSKLISKNIYKCIKFGIVNSISVMVGFNENYFDKIKKDRYLNIRLHLNLTENYKKSSLNENYSFLKLMLLRFTPNFMGHKENIKKEIESQIIYFKKKFNLKIIQIDSHEHIHVIPWINDIIVELKKKYNVVELREPIEKYYLVKFIDIIKAAYLMNIIKFLLIKFLSIFHNKNKKTLIKKNFTGILYTGFQNFNSIIKGIKINSKNDKTLEVLIHPGYTNYSEVRLFKNRYFNYYSSKNRINEFKLASSKKIISSLSKSRS